MEASEVVGEADDVETRSRRGDAGGRAIVGNDDLKQGEGTDSRADEEVLNP